MPTPLPSGPFSPAEVVVCPEDQDCAVAMMDGQQCRETCAEQQHPVGLGTCFHLHGDSSFVGNLAGDPRCIEKAAINPDTEVEQVHKIWVELHVLLETHGQQPSKAMFHDSIATALDLDMSSITIFAVVPSPASTIGGGAGEPARRLSSRAYHVAFEASVPPGRSANAVAQQILALASDDGQAALSTRLTGVYGIGLIAILSSTRVVVFVDEEFVVTQSPPAAVDQPEATSAADSTTLVFAMVCGSTLLLCCGVFCSLAARRYNRSKRAGALGELASLTDLRGDPTGCFDGQWLTADGLVTIHGDVLMWYTGMTSPLEIDSMTSLRMDFGGQEYLGVLEDGQLYWNDGEIWTRMELQAEKNPERPSNCGSPRVDMCDVGIDICSSEKSWGRSTPLSGTPLSGSGLRLRRSPATDSPGAKRRVVNGCPVTPPKDPWAMSSTSPQIVRGTSPNQVHLSKERSRLSFILDENEPVITPHHQDMARIGHLLRDRLFNSLEGSPIRPEPESNAELPKRTHRAQLWVNGSNAVEMQKKAWRAQMWADDDDVVCHQEGTPIRPPAEIKAELPKKTHRAQLWTDDDVVVCYQEGPPARTPSDSKAELPRKTQKAQLWANEDDDKILKAWAERFGPAADRDETRDEPAPELEPDSRSEIPAEIYSSRRLSTSANNMWQRDLAPSAVFGQEASYALDREIFAHGEEFMDAPETARSSRAPIGPGVELWTQDAVRQEHPTTSRLCSGHGPACRTSRPSVSALRDGLLNPHWENVDNFAPAPPPMRSRSPSEPPSPSVGSRTPVRSRSPERSQVIVTGIRHPGTRALGQYFFFSPHQWSHMVGTTSWPGRKYYIRQWRNGAQVYAGKVVVYDNTMGVYGKREHGSGARQWQVGDVVTLHSPPSAKAETDLSFDVQVGCEENVLDAIKAAVQDCDPAEYMLPTPDDIMLLDRNGDSLDPSVPLPRDKYPLRAQVLVRRITEASPVRRTSPPRSPGQDSDWSRNTILV